MLFTDATFYGFLETVACAIQVGFHFRLAKSLHAPSSLRATSEVVFFLLALFFAPLAGMVPAYASAAALLYVACVMTRGLADMDWSDVTEYAPAVVTAIAMPLTYSIATGIGLGFITYAVVKILAGKFADAKPAVMLLALVFVVKFAVG